MKIGDTVLWKGKPAKIFGCHGPEDKPMRWVIHMLNGRSNAAILWISAKSKHLAEIAEQHEKF